jgi:thiol-disulfide isomerase/thioredoxin
MKKIIGAFLGMLLTIGVFASNEKASVTIKLKNYKSVDKILLCPEKSKTNTIELTSKNSLFIKELNLEKGEVYKIRFAHDTYQLFVTPGSNVTLIADSTKVSSEFVHNKYEKAAKYEGDLTEENNFLVKYDPNFQFEQYVLHKLLHADKLKDGEKYKSLATAKYDELLTHFQKKSSKFHEDFTYVITSLLKVQYASSLDYFEGRVKHFSKENPTMPEDYYDYRKKYDYCNDEMYERLYRYRSHLGIMSYFGYENDEECLETIKEIFYKEGYRNRAFVAKTRVFATLSKEERKKLLSLLEKYVTDTETMAKIKEAYELANNSGEGKLAPNFKYKDVNDKEVQLSDFKGKYVYIDCWATWCGPCKAEIPHLQKLEKDYEGKNIVFMSISQDKNVDKWKKFVKGKNLHGVQLNSGSDRTFYNYFGVTGIPHFILIGKDGKVLRMIAPRPSDDKVRTMLNSLE